MTGKHQTGTHTKRCDKKYPEKCQFCNYNPKSNTNFMQHMLIYHSSKDDRKNKFTYFCDICDYGTFAIKSFNIHTKTNPKYSKVLMYLCFTGLVSRKRTRA